MIYPVVVAVLIGVALSRGPEEPRVAFLNQVPDAASTITLGDEEIDASQYADTLFESIDPVRVASRDEAIEAVRSGDVLAALIIPPDATQKLQGGVEPATVEVFYNAEDPAKQAFVENTIEAQIAEANAALTERFTEVALGYVDLLVEGGELSLLGRELDILGLARSQEILTDARDQLPDEAPARTGVEQVIEFARLALENLALTDDVLASVGQPVRVDATVVEGGSTSIGSFAAAVAVTVSLMFVTLLLAAGALAIEREENTFRRLVRGLVSRSELLVEKAGLAAACSAAAAFVMLVGLALLVGLDFARLPLWLAGLAAGAIAFAAMGVALGAVAREVRAASLLAFMLSLPIAFLALVPSGAVTGPLYDAIRVVSALFPFKPTLSAMDAALNDAGGLVVPLLHLLALTVGFGAVGRLALQRFE